MTQKYDSKILFILPCVIDLNFKQSKLKRLNFQQAELGLLKTDGYFA
jgi:hypothetical protein